VIEVENLTKRYGQHVAVDQLTFSVNRGEVLGFLGPNGAGKTTTMNIITGYVSATSGQVKVGGYDILEEPREVKKIIGYMPEIPPLYVDMTVNEYLSFVSSIKKIDKLAKRKDLEKIKQLVKIGDVQNRLIRNLSKGYRQRVGLAQALTGDPPVLILDEPTIGLDPNQILEIRALIQELSKDHTIVLSSHILPEITQVCERVIIINHGRIVASGTIEELSATFHGGHRLNVRVAGPEDRVIKTIHRLQTVKSAHVLGSYEPDTVDVCIEAEKGEDIRRLLFETMSKEHLPILLMRSMDESLEEIFYKLTTGDRGSV